MPAPDDARPDDAPPSTPAGGQADWLVGPEEGLAAEMQRRDAEDGSPHRPTLLRPSLSPEGGTAPPAPVTPPPTLRPPAPPDDADTPRPLARTAGGTQPVGSVRPDPPDDFERGPGMTWTPGAASVPQVRTAAAAPAPQPTHDFPMDDAEERAREIAGAAADAAAAVRAASAPHVVVSPEAFDEHSARVPWYMQLTHAVGADRRLQVLLGVVIAALATVALWPHGERPVSLAALRRHPERFDGVGVKVAGRVGEVFRVGEGFAFYLQDDRDTLVVFTRSREPRPRQHLTLTGTLSTGYLDGQRTLALFESTAR